MVRRIAQLKSAQSRGHHSKRQWREMLAMSSGLCVKCGSDRRVGKDHIIALSRGGSDSLLNIQPLCAVCNTTKSNRLAVDFRPREMRDFAMRCDVENMSAWTMPRKSRWIKIRERETALRQIA